MVHDLIKQHAIDCDLKPGILHANHRARFSRHSQKEVEHLHRVYSHDKVRFIDRPPGNSRNAWHKGLFQRYS